MKKKKEKNNILFKKIKGIFYSLTYLFFVILAVALSPVFFFVNWFIEFTTAPYDKITINCVVSPTGGGKSTLLSYLQKRNKNKGYILTNVKQADLPHVVKVDLEEIFKDNECLFNFNGSGVTDMHFDEIQNKFDNRSYSDKHYKSVFTPFIKMVSLHRHLKIKSITFVTQDYDNLDIKIKRLVHNVIEISHTKKIDKDYFAKNFLKIGFKAVRQVPNKLIGKVYTRKDYENNLAIKEDVKKGFFNSEIKPKVVYETFRIKIKKEILDLHNTYAFENEYIDKSVFNVNDYL